MLLLFTSPTSNIFAKLAGPLWSLNFFNTLNVFFILDYSTIGNSVNLARCCKNTTLAGIMLAPLRRLTISWSCANGNDILAPSFGWCPLKVIVQPEYESRGIVHNWALGVLVSSFFSLFVVCSYIQYSIYGKCVNRQKSAIIWGFYGGILQPVREIYSALSSCHTNSRSSHLGLFWPSANHNKKWRVSIHWSTSM